MYRKKPVVIEAHQWWRNGDHPLDYANDEEGFEDGKLVTFSGEYRKQKGWEGGVVRYYRHPSVPGERACAKCSHTMHLHGWIDTLEGGHTVCPGDWIITGVKGERYPCKPDIFAATYDPADITPTHDYTAGFRAGIEAALEQAELLTGRIRNLKPEASLRDVVNEMRQEHSDWAGRDPAELRDKPEEGHD